jgi:hypothetical protein
LTSPSSPSEAFIFTELRRKEVSFTAEMLAVVCDDCLHGQEWELQQRAPVSCCRFWWEVRPEDRLQELKLKAGDQRKGYEMKDQEAVGVTVQQNLSHVELPLC